MLLSSGAWSLTWGSARKQARPNQPPPPQRLSLLCTPLQHADLHRLALSAECTRKDARSHRSPHHTKSAAESPGTTAIDRSGRSSRSCSLSDPLQLLGECEPLLQFFRPLRSGPQIRWGHELLGLVMRELRPCPHHLIRDAAHLDCSPNPPKNVGGKKAQAPPSLQTPGHAADHGIPERQPHDALPGPSENPGATLRRRSRCCLPLSQWAWTVERVTLRTLARVTCLWRSL